MKRTKLLGTFFLGSALLLAVSCNTNRGFKAHQESKVGGIVPAGVCDDTSSTECIVATNTAQLDQLSLFQKQLSKSKIESDQKMSKLLEEFIQANKESLASTTEMSSAAMATFIAELKDQGKVAPEDLYNYSGEYTASVTVEPLVADTDAGTNNQTTTVNAKVRRTTEAGRVFVADVDVSSGEGEVIQVRDEETGESYGGATFRVKCEAASGEINASDCATMTIQTIDEEAGVSRAAILTQDENGNHIQVMAVNAPETEEVEEVSQEPSVDDDAAAVAPEEQTKTSQSSYGRVHYKSSKASYGRGQHPTPVSSTAKSAVPALNSDGSVNDGSNANMKKARQQRENAEKLATELRSERPKKVRTLDDVVDFERSTVPGQLRKAAKLRQDLQKAEKINSENPTNPVSNHVVSVSDDTEEEYK